MDALISDFIIPVYWCAHYLWLVFIFCIFVKLTCFLLAKGWPTYQMFIFVILKYNSFN